MDFSGPKLSNRTMKVMTVAGTDSREHGHHYVGLEHLFLALCKVEDPAVRQLFGAEPFDVDELARELLEDLPSLEERFRADDPLLTPRCRSVLALASWLAAGRRAAAVEPIHLMEAILREGRSGPVRLLTRKGFDLDDLKLFVASRAEAEQRTDSQSTATPLLDRFGRDLTALARKGRLSPVVGREHEIDLLAQVLLRKQKSNPVLVGEAGVGKTAIVEGLAQRLIAPDAPDSLRSARIVEVALGSIVAGTKYRGEFEERLLGIVGEAKQNRSIVLFIDEIHTIVGAGGAGDTSLDASNIMKPVLARGEIRCIGATTIEEYRRHVEKDAALERRFEPVRVEEPSREATLAILHCLRPSFEDYHEVRIEDPALVAAIDMTDRHLHDRRLPDKAIDALDQTCARRRFLAPAAREAAPSITAEDIARTISLATGIPTEKLSAGETASLLNLEDELARRVVGQPRAVEAVCRAIRMARVGLGDQKRPTGVFLFVGPTGVGKTELAKALADCLFGDTKRLIQFDMSEYQEPHAVSKLIGSPPGYVGSDREGALVAAVRRHPYSVILFDEIEKAHANIFDIFLQIFDEGRVTGSQGKSADFRNAVVILTSNLNPRLEKSRPALGFESKEPWEPPPLTGEMLRQLLIGHFRPELLNRIDEIILFERLDPLALRAIVDRTVAEVGELLAPKNISLSLDDDAYAVLLARGYDETFGARQLRRTVDRMLRQPLAGELLKRGPDFKGTVRVTVKEQQIVFS